MRTQLRAPTHKPIVLAAVRPNQGVQAKYRSELDRLIEEMNKSLEYWLSAAYRANPPEMAQDASPAVLMGEVMRRLSRRWQGRFNEAAPALAEYFAKAMHKRSDAQLQAILKNAGFSVSFTLTREMNDVLQATIAEQVGLIKSIAQKHLSEVEGLVMRSVAAGRDLGTLSKELQARFGVTKKRAALISRDQNNKATAVLTKTRQDGLGITEAIWLHSHAGKTPRPSHVAMNGKRYDVTKGAYLREGKHTIWTWPGVEINCRCVSKSVIPGLPSLPAMDEAPPFIESQHPRDAEGKFVKVQNGVTYPKQGTTTHKVWQLANQISNAVNKQAEHKAVKAAALEMGLNPATVATQYHLWSKFHGFSKPKELVSALIKEQAELTPLEKDLAVAKSLGPDATPSDAAKNITATYGYMKEGTFKGIDYFVKANNKVSYRSEDAGWIHWYKGVQHGQGKGLNSLEDHLAAFQQAFPMPAPGFKQPLLAEPSSPKDIKEVAKTLAKGSGFEYKVGNDTYNYYTKPDGSKISINYKTGAWKYSSSDGKVYSGKGAIGLQDKLTGQLGGGAHAQAFAQAQGQAFKGATAKQQVEETLGEFGFSDNGVPLPNSLPQHIQKSLTHYTGEAYAAINFTLRSNNQAPDSVVKKHILAIQKAFASAPPVKKQVTLSRKITSSALMTMVKEAGLTDISALQAGHVLKDDGFVSTSHNQNIWTSFKNDVQFNITVPIGAKALYLGQISKHKGEDETLLPSGTKFKITSVKAIAAPLVAMPDRKVYTLHAEVLI